MDFTARAGRPQACLEYSDVRPSKKRRLESTSHLLPSNVAGIAPTEIRDSRFAMLPAATPIFQNPVNYHHTVIPQSTYGIQLPEDFGSGLDDTWQQPRLELALAPIPGNDYFGATECFGEYPAWDTVAEAMIEPLPVLQEIATAYSEPADVLNTPIICFGMICGAWVSIFEDQQSCIPSNVSPTTMYDAGHLTLSKSGEDRWFLIHASVRIGTLDLRTARHLNSISSLESITFDVFFVSETQPATSPATNKPRAITINVYGSADISVEVGRILSKARVYLQQPDVLHDSITYENPHVYKRTTQESPPKLSQTFPSPQHTLNDAVSGILDSLANTRLSKSAIDCRITTKLLGTKAKG
ncbi:hypothetical protein K440DRAFT_629535 [Wilcoxina mikolae CBS 423.85]|nr:hypothetical protein K440DRAFT_629535 [Wilcoxina mikolae CBS 423.85]